LDAFLGVGKRVLTITLFDVRSGSVAEQDVVHGIQADRLSVLGNCLIQIVSIESVVSLSLQLLDLHTNKNRVNSETGRFKLQE
jgi:hypothetical protein